VWLVVTQKDYYDILGVSKTADEKKIKAAYRRLARKHHPDVNKGDKQAEERFKEVAEAFAVLSDPQKRARYDQAGHQAFGPGFDPFAGVDPDQFEFGFGDLSSLFEMFGFGAGGGRARGRARARAGVRPRGGQSIQLQVRIPFVQAVSGGTVEIAIPQRGSVTARIPAGIEDGGTLRLAGKGLAGAHGGPAGDALLRVEIEPHPVLRRTGRDLYVDVPLGLAHAALGGAIEVPTLDGNATVNVPAGTKSGQKLRLRGRGVPAAQGRAAGDLYAVVQIHPPKQLDARSRELLEEFRRLNPEP